MISTIYTMIWNMINIFLIPELKLIFGSKVKKVRDTIVLIAYKNYIIEETRDYLIF